MNCPTSCGCTPVPRGAFSWVTRKLKGHVSLPLVTTNRINDPQIAVAVLVHNTDLYGSFAAGPIMRAMIQEALQQ